MKRLNLRGSRALSSLRFGIEGLDSLIGGLRRGSLVLVYGRPGSGKTVMATTICYRNALDGKRAYYVTLYEDREKLYEFVKTLGMDFYELEAKGLFRHVRLPLLVGSTSKELFERLANDILDFRPDIIVVDSITSLLNAVGDKVLVRTLLHNFVYDFPKLTNGIVVLIAEVSKEPDLLLDVAYVADVVIELCYRLVNEYVVREARLHKVRGASISQARIPFTIASGSGIVMWTFPRLDEIPPPDYSKALKVRCEALSRVIGGYLYGGWSVFVTYDADARPYDFICFLLLNLLANRSKTLMVSYKLAPDDILRTVSKVVGVYCGREVDVKKALGQSVILKGFNPGTLSVEELYSLELNLISELRPDVVVFIGVDIPAYYYGPRVFKYLHSQILHLRKLGITSFRLGSYVDERSYRVNATLSDVVVRILKDTETLRPRIYVWSRGLRPSIIGCDELEPCLRDLSTSVFTGV